MAEPTQAAPVGVATYAGLSLAVAKLAGAAVAAYSERTAESLGLVAAATLDVGLVLGGRYAQAVARIRAAATIAAAPAPTELAEQTLEVVPAIATAENGDDELFTAGAEARIAEADTVVPPKPDEGDGVARAELQEVGDAA